MPLTLVASNTSGAQTISVPGGLQAGDLMVLFDYARNSAFSAPPNTIPSGFTAIVAAQNTVQSRWNLSYKIANGSETSLSGLTGSAEIRKILAIFRPSTGIITSVAVNDPDVQLTDANPAAQTVTAGSGTPPLLVIAAYSSNSSISPRTFSPAEDGELNRSTKFYLKYKAYDSSPSNVSVDMDDEGNDNYLASCYFTALLIATAVGAAAGKGTVSAVGASTATASGSVTGTSSVAAVGSPYFSAIGGNADGTSTVTGVGQALAEDSKGTAAGTSDVLGVGETTVYTTGAATGNCAALATGASVAEAEGLSTGTGTTSGVGASQAASIGSASGTSTTLGEGASVAHALGFAAGDCTVTAIQYIIARGDAAGTSIVIGDAGTVAEADGFAQGNSASHANGTAINDAIGDSTGLALVLGIGAPIAYAQGGDAAGSAIVIAVGGTIEWSAGTGQTGNWVPEGEAPNVWTPDSAQSGAWTQ